MNRPKVDLREHMPRPDSDLDVARQWRRLAPELGQPASRSRRRWWVLSTAAAAIGGVALLFAAGTWVRPGAPPLVQPQVAEGARVENQRESPRELHLTDGSRVTLGLGAVVVLARSRGDDVNLVIERGSAEFDVAHVAGRRFVVTAGQIDVVVVGTRFAIAVSDAEEGRVAAVSVQRGAVEVRRQHAAPLRLLTGESWSSAAGRPEPETPPDEAPEVVAPVPPPAATGDREKPAPVISARGLLEAATRARLRGDHREAAAALDKLCRRFPDDPRAALAAFELGRIQMDTLHERAPAVASFRTAMTLAREPALREDATARYVQALDTAGNASACRAARDEYLAQYPTGQHVARVAKYCRGR